MSDKIESMAVIADGMRELSDEELNQVFGGQCSPEADYCEVVCVEGIPNYSYELCYYGGSPICASPMAWDTPPYNCWWPY